MGPKGGQVATTRARAASGAAGRARGGGPARLTPLRRHLNIRLAVGVPLALIALLALAVTTVHAREARAFERRAERITALVVRAESEPAFVQHVTVGFRLGGRTIRGRAPVVDALHYRVGQEVAVLYDPADPQRVLLDEERYNAAGPALLWGAVLVSGLLTIGSGWWWVARCRRTATAAGPAFAMEATVAATRPRWWNRRRPWVTLLPLHGSVPVGGYPLMPGVDVPRANRASVEVKGNVRDGGLVVARLGEQVLWPRGRLRDLGAP